MLPLSSARFQAERTRNITESVIREMTRLAMQHNAVNLAQGFPDFAAPAHLKQAAIDAITSDQNQYAITWGTKRFRNAIAIKYRDYYQLEIDPERQITVTCGATEGMIASLLAIANPGDEVIVFEPYYENFGPDSYLCGATRKIVPLHAPDWSFDPEEVRRLDQVAVLLADCRHLLEDSEPQMISAPFQGEWADADGQEAAAA